MDAHKQIRLPGPGIIGAVGQCESPVTRARERDAEILFGKIRLDAAGNVEREFLLVTTRPAFRAAVAATVTGIEDDDRRSFAGGELAGTQYRVDSFERIDFGDPELAAVVHDGRTEPMRDAVDVDVAMVGFDD